MLDSVFRKHFIDCLCQSNASLAFVFGGYDGGFGVSRIPFRYALL